MDNTCYVYYIQKLELDEWITRYVYYIQELELDEWIVTRDSDWGEGYSSAELKMNSAGTGAVFSGELSTRVPADGRTQEAG